MRTRNQSRRPQQSNGEKQAAKSQGNADKVDDSETLTHISKDAVGKLLKRVKSRSQSLKKEDDPCLNVHDSQSIPESESKKKNGQCFGKSVIREEQNFSGDVTKNKSSDFGTKNDLDESDWEEGSIPILNGMKSSDSFTIKGVTVELDISPDPVKRKPSRRATVEEKEAAELMHKVNLLCLLGRGRSFDSACNDPLIQASLLSLLPARLLKIADVPKLTAETLIPLVNWFHKNFHVRGPGSAKKMPFSALASALEAHEGTAEEVAALSVALFRALNLTTRFVAVLDVVSLKPDMDKPESSSQGTSKAGSGIFNSSTLMVAGSGHTSVSPSKTAASEKDGDCQTSVLCESKAEAGKLLKDNSEYKDLPVVHKLKDRVSDPLSAETQDGVSDACVVKKSEGPKRKGDLEFEMQLEMALSATAIKHSKSDMHSNLVDIDNSPSSFSPACKKLKVVRAEETPVSPNEISTAIGSRKVGAPLYWAEVYCNGENLTGKWVHIDVVNAIVDGEQKVEAATAACKKSLRYVVAFAGLGAKDVTRRYCMKWHKIASQRVNPMWWDAVLAPLKELESRATGGIVHLEEEVPTIKKVEDLPVANNQIQVYPPDGAHITGKSNDEVYQNSTLKRELDSLSNPLSVSRSILEDMELDTRALTEPLPTNQQAYRNHQLYAIERWLTKYQILYPKGPVLGFCSGHPIYPRTCVQTLHTKERWLREGRQVKANELPSKILKRSLKHRKVQKDDDDDDGGDDDDCVEGDHVALYGKWQTELLCLPHAVDGIVPKNERGQVDVWSEKCLPPGTVHLRFPRVAVVAKRLEIDFAPAMVGFEFRNGRSIPVFEGIVVCSEFKDAILEAYEEEEERREAEERKRKEAQALSRWYQLLSSIVTRQRLQNCYGEGAPWQASTGIQKPNDTSSAGAGGNQDRRVSPDHQQDNFHDNKVYTQQYIPTEDHEHIFLPDDEAFDGESSTRTKRCRCGFSIQFEEL